MEFKELVVLNETQEQAVSGRLLHEALGVKTEYKDWFPRMVEYGFTEGEDFNPLKIERVQQEGDRMVSREVTDHILTLDMAKQLCMITRNEKGMAIRKYFIEVEKDYNSPMKTMARALLFADKSIKEKDVEIKQLNAQIEADKPKVLFANALTASKSTILVRDLAKMLKDNGVEIGEKRFYKWLRERGYICQNSTTPTQKAMELGLFEIDTHIIQRNGESLPIEKSTTRITTKGQEYFIGKFLYEERR